jgi:DNA-binding transcriptional ArsR family regulator
MVEPKEAVLDRVFHALADPSRRAILARLATGEHTVSELAEPLPMSMAAASKHIKVLEESGLVRRSVEWRTHTCSLNAEPLVAAQTWLKFYEQFWGERLDALEQLFREKKKKKK